MNLNDLLQVEGLRLPVSPQKNCLKSLFCEERDKSSLSFFLGECAWCWCPEVSQIYNPKASLKKVDGENGPVSTCPRAPGQASILLRSQTEPLRSPLGQYLLQGSSILSHTQCLDSLYLFLLRIQAVYLNSCIINSPILRTDIFMCRDVGMP